MGLSAYPDCKLGRIMHGMVDAMNGVVDAYAESKHTEMEGMDWDDDAFKSLARGFADESVATGGVAVAVKFNNARLRKQFLCCYTRSSEGTVNAELDFPNLEKEDPVDVR